MSARVVHRTGAVAEPDSLIMATIADADLHTADAGNRADWFITE